MSQCTSSAPSSPHPISPSSPPTQWNRNREDDNDDDDAENDDKNDDDDDDAADAGLASSDVSPRASLDATAAINRTSSRNSVAFRRASTAMG